MEHMIFGILLIIAIPLGFTISTIGLIAKRNSVKVIIG